MSKTAIEIFAAAIGYPESVPDGADAFVFRVDGGEVLASVSNGRLVLSHKLTDDQDLLPDLASFAAGRMLREDAVLAFGELGGSQCAFLWQDAPAAGDSRIFTRLFETFMDSCDWWKARVEGARGETAEIPSMMIRP
jgi:hypothetical protein